MPRQPRDLTDAQWAILDPLIPAPELRKITAGGPWKARRSVLNGILWVLRAGAPRADLPDHYHSYQTCHRRFQQWVLSGVMKGVVQALAEQLRVAGDLDVGVQIEARSVLQSDEHQIRDAVLAYFFRPSGWITYRLAFVSRARGTPVNPPYRTLFFPEATTWSGRVRLPSTLRELWLI